MSTYYQLGCDDCKDNTSTISRNKDMQAPEDVYNFMFQHEGHSLVFYSEYDDSRYTTYSRDFQSPKQQASKEVLDEVRFIVGNYIEYHRTSLPQVSELESRMDGLLNKFGVTG